ncbi:MAG: peptidoglycan DD-metalloendopeptidase family protein [Bacteroidetes bacterium]|nr:peptidoglycan DD-metalloendopeptidase family protein [Bacteroidota bacterium]
MRDRPLLVVAALIAIGTFLVIRANSLPFGNGASMDSLIQTASLSVDEYGIDQSQYEVLDAVVASDETFTDLLTPYKVDYKRIVQLASEGRDIFDVRQLRARRPYRVYTDTAGVARVMVYEKDQTSFVIFNLGENPTIHLKNKEVSTVIREVSGVIDSSLYTTLLDQDIHPAVAGRMSEVFAWQIDFYRIQKGDAFRIIFEEQLVDGEMVDVGEILAARFVHMEDDFFGFYFDEGNINEHYDETGKSLRKAFLMAPVDFSRISSGFSSNRFHPVQKRYKAHLGTDYAADRGTPIRATGDGIVAEAGYGQYNGNYVKIKHNATYTTQYLHMSKIASGMKPGTRVRQGQTIGYVGATGLATGNHVCYRFWKNGQQVDHRREKMPSSGPIPVQYMNDFEVLRDTYMVQLSTPITPTPKSRFPMIEAHAAVAAP